MAMSARFLEETGWLRSQHLLRREYGLRAEPCDARIQSRIQSFPYPAHFLPLRPDLAAEPDVT